MGESKNREIITEVFFGTLIVFVILLAVRVFYPDTGLSPFEVVSWGVNFICMMTALGLLCGSADHKREFLSLGFLSGISLFVCYCVKIYIIYACFKDLGANYNLPLLGAIDQVQLSAAAFWIVAIFRGISLKQEEQKQQELL